MLFAGRHMIGNSPFLQGWQQEYMKAHGSMPPTNKVLDFLTEVIDNQAIKQTSRDEVVGSNAKI